MSLLRTAVHSDALTLVQVGQLLGDPETPSGAPGSQARRLIAAAEARQLEVPGLQLLHTFALVSREALARFLTTHGTPGDRHGHAFAWAHGIGRIAPPAVKFAAGPLGQADVRGACHLFRAGAKLRTFTGQAYGGGVITDHPTLDRVAFDLDTTAFKVPAPVLLSHDAPIGVVDAARMARNITVDGRLFADVEGPAKNVADMADRGMPWQLSVYIKPGSIEEYKAGTKVKLNGQTFDGPLTVFRNSRVREVSFCALGADDKTTASLAGQG